MAPITAIQFGAHRTIEKAVTTATGKPVEGLQGIGVAIGAPALGRNGAPVRRMALERSQAASSNVRTARSLAPRLICLQSLGRQPDPSHVLPQVLGPPLQLWAARQSSS